MEPTRTRVRRHPVPSAAPGGADDAVVEVVELVKRYPGLPAPAVDRVSFEVRRGEVFGLLGPNGAGKTTTVGILTTLVRPTAGMARVGGIDVRTDPMRVRGLVAVVPQRNNLDRSLSIRQNLLFHAAYHGVPAAERAERAARLLEQFGLADRADDKPDFFSGGQSQRVMIARALMHSPLVLFLDEPTTGLDPAARLFVWDRLRELRDSGVTLVLTTHDMDEAAALADRVGIMDHGRLLALDTPEALTRSLPGSRTLDLTTDDGTDRVPEVLDALQTLPGVERVERVVPESPRGPGGGAGGDGAGRGRLRLRLYVSGDAPALVAPAAAVLDRCGLELSEVGIGVPSLEDVFIHLTGRALR